MSLFWMITLTLILHISFSSIISQHDLNHFSSTPKSIEEFYMYSVYRSKNIVANYQWYVLMYYYLFI